MSSTHFWFTVPIMHFHWSCANLHRSKYCTVHCESHRPGGEERRGVLTVPLLLGDLTPVLAHGEDVFEQQAAVVLPVRPTGVGAPQHVHHVRQQLRALQLRAS